MRQALARAYGKTVWSPYIAAIQDFVREEDGRSFPENLSLLLTLYEVYRKRMLKIDAGWHEPFERFYPWGEMLLRDFDEVDKYLVNADELFTNVRDLREIELTFGLSEEDRKAVAQFWNTVYPEKAEGESISPTREQFLFIWGILHDVYHQFRKVLEDRSQAYDGMAYRELATAAKAKTFTPAADHVFFVGFNALSKAEQVLMRALLDQEKATVFWDVDEHFLTNDTPIGEEAGFFILQQHKQWEGKGSVLIKHHSQTVDKQVHITGAPLATGQAQYAGNILRKLDLQGEKAKHTAVVLADEHMLFPLLHALPDTVDRLNITMGFPLRQTTIHDILQGALKLVQSQEFDGGDQASFPYAAVFDLLSNSYLQIMTEGAVQGWKQEIAKQNLVQVPAHFFKEKSTDYPFSAALFSPPKNKEDFIPWLEKVFTLLLEDAQERDATLEAEYTFQLYTRLNQFKTAFADFEAPITLYGMASILAESFRRARIPFEGEPLEGLQLMGFLETRTLDFERVIMLGVNEGKLPSNSAGNSFIPYHLRRGFGLPTFEQKDAIFAYHFFRLMMRAGEVWILYNNQQSDTGGAQEMSRYMHQLRHFGDAFPAWNIQEQQVSIEAPFSENLPIRVAASRSTKERLYNKYINTQGKRQQALSPTAFTTWLRCRLRFYFRYVADLKEPEAVAESMEANTFGSVLHLTQELLYKDWQGKTVNRTIIEQKIKPLLSQALKVAFEKEAQLNITALRGRNYLMRDVLEQLCEGLLEQDASLGEFSPAGLEVKQKTELTTPQGKVRISGIVDRLDQLPNGDWRIIDYKTGKLEFPSKGHSLDDVFNSTYTNSAKGLKEAFQGYMYSWLFLKDHPEAQVQTGFYVVKTMSQGILFLANGEKLRSDHFGKMEALLSELIQKMFNEPYTQTEDEVQCKTCPYNTMCNRG